MRIGVFGGSFDPIHVGHLIVAEAAADRLELNRVHFVPAHQQPFKAGEHAAPAPDRVAMLRLAIEDNPRFLLDLREVNRVGTSYTIETLRELRAEYPADELFLMIGADAALELPLWREAEALSLYAVVVALTRPGVTGGAAPLVDRVVEVPAIGVSASSIRLRAARGGSIRYLVPDPVADYIAAHGLYGTGDSC